MLFLRFPSLPFRIPLFFPIFEFALVAFPYSLFAPISLSLLARRSFFVVFFLLLYAPLERWETVGGEKGFLSFVYYFSKGKGGISGREDRLLFFTLIAVHFRSSFAFRIVCLPSYLCCCFGRYISIFLTLLLLLLLTLTTHHRLAPCESLLLLLHLCLCRLSCLLHMER